MTSRRRLGRRAGQVVYYLAVGSFVAVATWQLTAQVFFQEPSPIGPAPQTCEAGLTSLLRGVDDARRAARSLEAEGNDEIALALFRGALEPVWSHRPTVGELCQGRSQKRLLDAIDRLRYSEEHGVRKQASELSALRRRVARLAASTLPHSTASPSTAPPSTAPHGAPSPAQGREEKEQTQP